MAREARTLPLPQNASADTAGAEFETFREIQWEDSVSKDEFKEKLRIVKHIAEVLGTSNDRCYKTLYDLAWQKIYLVQQKERLRRINPSPPSSHQSAYPSPTEPFTSPIPNASSKKGQKRSYNDMTGGDDQDDNGTPYIETPLTSPLVFREAGAGGESGKFDKGAADGGQAVPYDKSLGWNPEMDGPGSRLMEEYGSAKGKEKPMFAVECSWGSMPNVDSIFGLLDDTAGEEGKEDRSLVKIVMSIRRRVKEQLGKERSGWVVKLATVPKVLSVLVESLAAFEESMDVEELDEVLDNLKAVAGFEGC
ncbi:hypothetical protein HK097_011398 [Rhizophlyctis rosea]|uniref:Uncharacterized protein n=1 Tax=Rhizophlyctis rosea TaxID=64517 RepID=A0AAD5S979_9FUNG|nr:hypothetical protein HK097_011398 [Rhizophlyctis rosea]